MPDVTLPGWFFWSLVACATIALLDRLLVPSVRWYFRRRVNRVIEELNTRLPIRLRSFQLTKRQVLIDRLIHDPAVLEAAHTHAKEAGEPVAVTTERVERYAKEIVPAFNAYVYFRVGYWLARRLAKLLYRVRLGFADERRLREIDPQSTIVFVMNHRSNADYVLVAYLAASRTALSYAVGEWARVWPLQSLIRAMGAYFVRRNSGNALYRRVLERYVQMATESGVTQALYPEGRLSRDGRLGEPRLGVFDYMLRTFDPDEGRDLVFVPVGINYDRVLEDRSLLRSLDPEAKPVGRGKVFWTSVVFFAHNLVLMLLNRWYRFGYACVNFGRPLSARAWLRERRVDLRELEKEERITHVKALADDLMEEVGRSVPVLSVALVSTVMLESRELALGPLEVKARVFELARELEAGGAHLYVPRRDRDYAVGVGLRALSLRHLLIEEDGLYRLAPNGEPILRYYANSIAHHERAEFRVGAETEPPDSASAVPSSGKSTP